jgi:sec-independent protein translocase protein TatC
MSSENKIPIREHLGELRKCLIRWLIVAAIATGVCFYFARYIFAALEAQAEGINLIYIEMTEMIATYCKVAIFGGIALSSPILIYEVIKFVHPALTSREKGYLYGLLPGVLLAFAAGAAFGYFVLIPPAAHFLITFGSDIATPTIKVGNFVSIMIRLLFAIGIGFETPIAIFFLAKIGIVSAGKLLKWWKFAIIGAFALGAIITPTFDPINQSLVAVPLIVLYGIGILLAKLARRGEEVPVPAETTA